MSAKVEVSIFDTTLRDGAQALPEQNQFLEGTKWKTANVLARLGIGVIEAGFPRTIGDEEEVRLIAEKVGSQCYESGQWQNGSLNNTDFSPPVITGLSRTTPEDIDITWSAISPAKRPRIHTFVSTDAEHMRAKFPGKSPDDVLEMARFAVSYAKDISSENQKSSVEFSAEAATTTNMNYLERIVKTTIDQGADIINLPDTVGQMNPFEMLAFYKKALEWIDKSNRDVVLSAHNHNDLNNAVANSMALVFAASEHAVNKDDLVRVQLETTVCGLGERAGNADIFPVMANLFKFAPDLTPDIHWQFNPLKSVHTAQMVMNAAGLVVPSKSPVVGDGTNVHRSGIHSDGVIKGGRQGYSLYSPITPTFWGHISNAIHEDGRYQGRAGKSAASQH